MNVLLGLVWLVIRYVLVINKFTLHYTKHWWHAGTAGSLDGRGSSTGVRDSAAAATALPCASERAGGNEVRLQAAWSACRIRRFAETCRRRVEPRRLARYYWKRFWDEAVELRRYAIRTTRMQSDDRQRAAHWRGHLLLPRTARCFGRAIKYEHYIARAACHSHTALETLRERSRGQR